MKKILTVLSIAFTSLVFSQQGPAYSGDYLNYTIDTDSEQISVILPKGSKVEKDGKLVIDGKNYTVKTLKSEDFPVDEKYTNDTISQHKKNLIKLSGVWPKLSMVNSSPFPRTVESLNSIESQWRKMTDGEFIITWHGYKKNNPSEQSTKLSGAKVTGNSILILTLEDASDHRTEDFKNTRKNMYDILDKAVYIDKENPKPNKA